METNISKKADLEQAANNHIRKVADAAGHPGWDWTTQDIVDAFIAGAEWQREKMKKEELEGEIWEAINRYELEKKLNHEEGD